LNATPRLCDPSLLGSNRVDLGVAGRILFQEESLIRGVEPKSLETGYVYVLAKARESLRSQMAL
jgi:hypothetical protein